MKLGFERSDQRFEALQIQMDRRFDTVDKRFEDVDKRFEDVNKRFEDVNKKFDDMGKRFSMMFAFMNIGMSLIILMTILFKFVT